MEVEGPLRRHGFDTHKEEWASQREPSLHEGQGGWHPAARGVKEKQMCGSLYRACTGHWGKHSACISSFNPLYSPRRKEPLLSFPIHSTGNWGSARLNSFSRSHSKSRAEKGYSMKTMLSWETVGFSFFADFLISAKIGLALSIKSSSGLSSTQRVRCKVNQMNITEHTLCTSCSTSIIPFDHHQRGVIINSIFKWSNWGSEKLPDSWVATPEFFKPGSSWWPKPMLSPFILFPRQSHEVKKNKVAKNKWTSSQAPEK